MEKYWQSKEILRRLIFLPSAPDATDGCGRNVKFCTKRFDITVVEDKFHMLQKTIPRAREVIFEEGPPKEIDIFSVKGGGLGIFSILLPYVKYLAY